jgi:hypothetical protein
VTIICGDNSHPGKVVQIAFFHKRPGAEWWIFPPTGFVNGNNRWAMQEMDGDRPLSEEEMDAMFAGKDVVILDRRFRYSLACPLCRYTLPVRHENLNPVLDTLAQNALETIELRSLGARLGSSKRSNRAGS